MKRSRRTGLIILVAIVVLAGLAGPFVLTRLASLRGGIVDGLAARLSADITLASADWDWFPRPRLVLSELVVHRESAELKVPHAWFSPSWGIVSSALGKIGTIHLDRPVLHLQTVQRTPGGGGIAALDLEIRDGTVTVAVEKDLQKIFSGTTADLAALNGRFSLRRTGIDFQTSLSTVHADRIEMKGRVGGSDKSYAVDFRLDGYQASPLLEYLTDGRMRTGEDKVDLRGSFEGRGTDRLKADVQGTLPALVVKGAAGDVKIGGGPVRLDLSDEGDLQQLFVHELALSEPAVELEGTVERRKGPRAGGQDTGGATWEVDLRGTRADLSSARAKVLALWGDTKTAAAVCDIIRGGEASKIRYRYSGPGAGFRNPDKFLLEADVGGAAIHVPQGGLDVEDASGSIAISDGVLRGEKLRARLGSSQGSNGALVLDLLGMDEPFALSLDLDADLSDLKPVLKKVVRNARFLEEMAKFDKVGGKASGRLALKDSGKGMLVDVQLAGGSIHTGYSEIPWLVDLRGGTLSVEGEKVGWKDVSANVGPHDVRDFAGSVSWNREKFHLQVNKLNASVDAAELHRFLRNKTIIAEDFSKVITSVNGAMEIGDAAFDGESDDPAGWRYGASVKTHGVSWLSPKTPGRVEATKASGKFSENTLAITEGVFRILGQEQTVYADLTHRGFQHWQGSIRIEGIVQQDLADWVKGQHWFPAVLLPRTPATLEKFELVLTKGAVEVRGDVLAEKVPNEPQRPRVKFDLGVGEKRVDIRKLEVTEEGGNAVITCRLDRSMSLRNGECSARGILSLATVYRLFALDNHISGSLEGDFSFAAPGEDRGGRFEGSLEGRELVWTWGPATSRPSELPQQVSLNVRLRGDGKLVAVEGLELRADGELVSGRGTLNMGGDRAVVDLGLSTELISRATLERFLSNTIGQGAGEGGGLEAERRPEKGPDFRVEGEVGFEAAKFVWNYGALPGPDGKAGEETVTAKDLKGTVTFGTDAGTRTEIRSGSLCGVGFSGTVVKKEGPPEMVLRFSTDREKPPRFEETLPCLGMTENLTEGSLNLDGIVERKNDTWSRGRVRLEGRDVTIQRSRVLSKTMDAVDENDVIPEEHEETLRREGKRFSRVYLEGEIHSDRMVTRKGALIGDVVDIFADGSLDLRTLEADMTLLIAPLRAVDAVVTKIPLVGRILGGKNEAIITIAVGLKGDIRNPAVSILPASSIGKGLLNTATNALLLPFGVFGLDRRDEGWGPELELPEQQ